MCIRDSQLTVYCCRGTCPQLTMYFCRGTCPAQLRCVVILYMSHVVASMYRKVWFFTFAMRCYLIPLTVKLSMYCGCYSGTSCKVVCHGRTDIQLTELARLSTRDACGQAWPLLLPGIIDRAWKKPLSAYARTFEKVGVLPACPVGCVLEKGSQGQTVDVEFSVRNTRGVAVSRQRCHVVS